MQIYLIGVDFMFEKVRKISRTFVLTVAATIFGALVLLVPMQAVGAAETDSITVQVNMARILRIGSPAQTVIIGNPGIADVTIQDPQTLVLTGRGYGRTNLIVLDSMGNPIADTIVEVVQVQSELVTVFQGSSRTTLACSPNCQPIVLLGDDNEFTSATIGSSALVAASAN